MRIKEYNREEAVKYAHKWAYLRNPQYYNFDPVGGDCTSFISQCIYSGSKVMNYSKLGWYYKSGNDKSPSWSGVEFLYNFLTTNKGVGPFGKDVDIEGIQKGDIIQVSFDSIKFAHTLIVVDIKENKNNLENILIASHTFDSDYRKISTYRFSKLRFVHIEGVRIN